MVRGVPIAQFDFSSGMLTGPVIGRTSKTLGEMTWAWRDRTALTALDPATIVYSVEYWKPVEEGRTGGLFMGTTAIEPGRVGSEYFMTQGHFHVLRDRPEFYLTVAGEGGLILMDEAGTRWEQMTPGSLHYIPGGVAHRVANTGNARFVILACWPSDAGHDYDPIRQTGFGARLLDVNGKPALVPER
jgi:glucose-6-phosphate isomerase, archaeal